MVMETGGHLVYGGLAENKKAGYLLQVCPHGGNKVDNVKPTTSSFCYALNLTPNKQSLKEKEKCLEKIKRVPKM